MSKYPQISDNPEIQERYEKLRRAGNNDGFARMLAEQKPPGYQNKYSPMHPRRNRGRGF